VVLPGVVLNTRVVHNASEQNGRVRIGVEVGCTICRNTIVCARERLEKCKTVIAALSASFACVGIVQSGSIWHGNRLYGARECRCRVVHISVVPGDRYGAAEVICDRLELSLRSVRQIPGISTLVNDLQGSACDIAGSVAGAIGSGARIPVWNKQPHE